jgi:hypothetical protein
MHHPTGRAQFYIPQPLLPERAKESRKALSGLPLAHFWKREADKQKKKAEPWLSFQSLSLTQSGFKAALEPRSILDAAT